jgi:hypothetical protein
MNINSLSIGMNVRHPQYGVGVVKTISEHTAEVRFADNALRIIEPQAAELTPAEAHATVAGLEMPLRQFVGETVEAVLARLGVENPDAAVSELGARWNGGKVMLHPADPALQAKEVPMEVFFHKIVMMRNQLRVLEQKVNAHEKLSDGEKVEMQQYITRCYGTMTTFNILFRDKGGQFNT